MANLVPELNSLDFSVYIGGPLQAAVQAQQAASMAAVKFIQDVGFTTNTAGDTELRYVDFDYKKSVPNPNFGSTATNLPAGTNVTDPYITSDVSVKVPFLVMLQIPSLRIDTITIDFNARLTSTETSNVTTELGITAELGINYKIVNFKASASYKRTTSRGEQVEKTYSLAVNVHAVQDELPAGLDRILTLLEDSIVSK
jgi:Protein of unknown function (DUF2589)